MMQNLINDTKTHTNIPTVLSMDLSLDWEVPYTEQNKKNLHLNLAVYFLFIFIAIQYCK